MKLRTFARWIMIVAIAGVQPAMAAVITDTLGNDSPGFADGAVPNIITQVIPAQSGQPAPFDQAYGSDIFSNFSQSWTHSYGVPMGTITAASITIGIVDHDSAASGDQVLSFSLDGTSLTVALNTAFNAAGEGADGQYDVYTITLPAGLFTALADGSALASLALQGPGLQTAAVGGAVTETSFNGAFLIYSTLSLTTETAPGPGPNELPAPPVVALLGIGLGLLGLRRKSH